MESSKKATLINAAWKGWYARGSDRLERSMIYHGWNYDMHIWKDKKINELFQSKYPYTIKAAAFMEAIRMGYTHILWMDCSLWVINDPNKLMQMVDEQGGLFIQSGYNLAQTSADSDLQWANVSRDDAEKMPELWSCILGINLETEKGKKFMHHFFDACAAGVFNTPRTHSKKSEDPRFLHARQDQTAASFAYHKAGYTNMLPPQEILSNYDLQDKPGDHTIVALKHVVTMRGM